MSEPVRHPVSRFALCALLLAGAVPAWSDQRAELLTLRNTMVSMIEQLVARGVIDEKEAVALIDRAEREAQEETAREVAEAEAQSDAVRVTYVPQVVRDSLREELRGDLRDVVVQDVAQQAREEGWGTPAGLPAWIYDIRWKADLRVRQQSEIFSSGNFPAFNFQAINDAGSVTGAGENALLNVEQNRHTTRGRMRLGLNTRLSDRWHGGLRVTSGTEGSPITRNAVFTQTDPEFTTNVDLAFVHYRSPNFIFTAGRMPNPYVHSSLVWDRDLTFEGATASGVLPLEFLGMDGQGYLTGGVHPLEETKFSSRDKWLYAAQLGVQFQHDSGARMGAAAAFYQFDNVAGRRNAPESFKYDFTAPAFMTKGNTLFDIRNDTDPDTRRFALVSDYELVNTTVYYVSPALDWSVGGKALHASVSGDYVQNVGWDQRQVEERTGVIGIDERTVGYHLDLTLGHAVVEALGDFTVAALYRHLERDAVIDAFTDSNFHLGGTDAEGWGLEARYGLAERVWLTARYLSANEIDGPPLGIDVLQLDLNARF